MDNPDLVQTNKHNLKIKIGKIGHGRVKLKRA